jgi:hypothetical protein
MFITMQGLCELIKANTKHNAFIRPTYIDYGANWIEDTIIVENKTSTFSTYQLLSPRQLEAFKLGTFTLTEAEHIVSEIKYRGW